MKFWKTLRLLIISSSGLVLVFVALQTLPVWEFAPMMDPRNPPVRYEIQWAPPETAHIMETVCYTCHSNETEYPLYMRIAPLSWIAARNVNEGRARLNFSEQPLDTINMNLLIAMIQADVMPPPAYRLTHPEANLTPEQKQRLIEGIQTTFSRVSTDQPSDSTPS